jgi:hypothetical protein
MLTRIRTLLRRLLPPVLSLHQWSLVAATCWFSAIAAWALAWALHLHNCRNRAHG